MVYSVEVNRRFGGKYYPHLQYRRVRQASLLSSYWILAWFTFQPWTCRDLFIWNVGWLSTYYTVLHPRRIHLCISLLYISILSSCNITGLTKAWKHHPFSTIVYMIQCSWRSVHSVALLFLIGYFISAE
jgi:hypothetical protein